MSRMIEKEKICMNCRWYCFEDVDEGMVCMNIESEYMAEFVGDHDTCKEWEDKDE